MCWHAQRGTLLIAVTLAWVAVQSPGVAAPPGGRSAVIGRLVGPRRAAPSRRASALGAEDPSLRLVVSEVPPPPPTARKPAPRATSRRRHRRYYYGYTRQPAPLYLRKRPGGEPTFRLKVGLLMQLLRTRGRWSEVETAGRIRARGWVPSVTLGLRVQRTTSLYARPGGRAFGKVAPGQLVHVVRVRRGWAEVRLMGWLPVGCWMKRTDLATARTRYASLSTSYPGGSRMVVSAGPLHARAGGPVVARALDEGRIYRVRVSGRWSQIAMMDYRRVDLRLWVPTARLRWGGYPSFGSGYQSSNCVAGTSGDYVALEPFRAYAVRDDARPTVRILPKARFRVAPAGSGWVRIYSYGCLRFSAYVEARAGKYARAALVSRR